MKTLWFVVPVHGRRQLAAICLRQLRRTCDALIEHGVHASAVVIADRSNLRDMRGRLNGDMLGFATVERDNQFVSRRFNDGIQLACDPRHNPHPADYVVPCGSDDWVDHRLFLNLPPANTMVGFQWASFVREDGAEIVAKNINYPGGVGIRIYPSALMAGLGFRPADEDRLRACDTSILVNLQRHHGDHMRIVHRHLHERQIVDWKTKGLQLNTYSDLNRHQGVVAPSDPFVELAGVYPDEALEEMAAHYGRVREQVAA